MSNDRLLQCHSDLQIAPDVREVILGMPDHEAKNALADIRIATGIANGKRSIQMQVEDTPASTISAQESVISVKPDTNVLLVEPAQENMPA